MDYSPAVISSLLVISDDLVNCLFGGGLDGEIVAVFTSLPVDGANDVFWADNSSGDRLRLGSELKAAAAEAADSSASTFACSSFPSSSAICASNWLRAESSWLSSPSLSFRSISNCTASARVVVATLM